MSLSPEAQASLDDLKSQLDTWAKEGDILSTTEMSCTIALLFLRDFDTIPEAKADLIAKCLQLHSLAARIDTLKILLKTLQEKNAEAISIRSILKGITTFIQKYDISRRGLKNFLSCLDIKGTPS
jgi:hypothetical protein